jgi:hypothetical protein
MPAVRFSLVEVLRDDAGGISINGDLEGVGDLRHRGPHTGSHHAQRLRHEGVSVQRWRGGPGRAVGRRFISGGAWPGGSFVTVAERLRHDSGWRVDEIPVGRNIAGRVPGGLAAVLGVLRPAEGSA